MIAFAAALRMEKLGGKDDFSVKPRWDLAAAG